MIELTDPPIGLEPLTASIGAIVTGIDLREPLTAGVVDDAARRVAALARRVPS